MASFSVQYIFSLVDKFSPGADKMGAAAKKIAGAVDQAGKAVSSLGSGAGRISGVFSAIASGASNAASALARYAKALMSANSVPPPKGGGSFGAAAALADRRAREVATAARQKRADAIKGFITPHGPANIYATGALVHAGAHGADSFIKQFAEPDTMRRKLAFTMGSDEHAEMMANRALESAKVMSSKYRNTTVTENMHIIDDLQANLPESMDKILEHSLEPFVKMHSFFKAWEGGKHSGKHTDSLKEIGIAIRSGELMGNMTGDEIAAHAHHLSVAKAIFGEKFKLSEYFASQKAASMALPGMSDQFKYIGFPLLVQELGTRAGVGLATQFQKMVGGGKLTDGQVRRWRELGLVDESKFTKDMYNKDGSIKAKRLNGKQWMKDIKSDDPFRDMVERVLPALAKEGNVKGLDSKAYAEIKRAWEAKDAEAIAHAIGKLDRNDMARELSALYGDRTAIAESFAQIYRLASLARDYMRAEQAEKSFKNADPSKPIDGYESSKDRLTASINRAANSAFGTDSIGIIIKGLDALGNAVERLGKGIGSLTGLGKAASDYWNNAQKLPEGYGDVWKFGREAYWRAQAQAERGADFDRIVGKNPMAEAANAAANANRTAFDNFGRLPEAQSSWRDYMPSMLGMGTPSPASWEGRSFTGDAASAIPQSMAIRMEPLTVSPVPPVPIQVQVQVSGQVNGPVTGSGSGRGEFSMTTNSPRGTATPEAGAPAPN